MNLRLFLTVFFFAFFFLFVLHLNICINITPVLVLQYCGVRFPPHPLLSLSLSLSLSLCCVGLLTEQTSVQHVWRQAERATDSGSRLEEHQIQAAGWKSTRFRQQAGRAPDSGSRLQAGRAPEAGRGLEQLPDGGSLERCEIMCSPPI